jgi:predicted nucleic acid-binding protein
VIFVDTNVFYSVLVKTESSLAARNIITMPSKLATSATVLNELVFISLRKLCKERYGIKSYSEFRKIIAIEGYEPFRDDLNLIFRRVEERDIIVLPVNDDLEDWKKVMITYKLLPNDAMIVSTCLLHEIKEIATFDNDFRRVEPLKLIGPGNKTS